MTIPKEYAPEEYRLTPQTPVFDGADGGYPIVAAAEWEGKIIEVTIDMYSYDYGLTWSFEP